MANAERLITENIDLWTSTIKRKSSAGRGGGKKVELYGVKKLRELILDLAVRGLLVPQDAGDEPVSELLESISFERNTLLDERKVKYRVIPEHPDIPSLLHRLPETWSWEEFSKVVFFQEGPGIRKWQFVESGTKLLNVSNILPDGSLNFSNSDKFVSLEEFNQKYTHFKIDEGDLLFAGSGGSWGKSSWFVDPGFKVMLNTSTLRLKFFSTKFSPNYLKYFLDSVCFKKQMVVQLVGIQPNFGSTHFNKIFIPIPSASEQHRIVAKVDELMALCDQLEQQTEASLAAHQTLVETLLGALTQAASQAESQRADDAPTPFEQAWHRLAEHFDTVFTTEHSIDQLKQTILQLAVMGKLVPQDPTDEPASELLKRIAAEKAELVKAKKIKKQKALPEISEEEKPFALPVGWEWCHVWDIAHTITSGSRDWAKYYADTGAIFVTMGNLSRGSYQLRLDNIRYVNPPKDGEGNRTRLVENDLLISITGDVGNLGLIPPNFGEAYINQHTAMLRFMPDCQGTFFPDLMRSPIAIDQFNAPQRGVKNSFRLGDVGEMVIPIPPMKEQNRIVAKVDELMALCDQLKTRLSDAQSTQLQLTDAVTEQAIN